MTRRMRWTIVGTALLSIGLLLARPDAQAPEMDVAIDPDDLGGIVTGPDGPEAGVWVIAETSELPTGFRKIVVTDDAGRFVVPDLPDATYEVWVRGYGLVDSARTSARHSSACFRLRER